MWLKVGSAQYLLVQVFYIEFDQCLQNGLWDICKYPVMALYKPGTIMDKSVLSDNF
jgi:hypothetical protein